MIDYEKFNDLTFDKVLELHNAIDACGGRIEYSNPVHGRVIVFYNEEDEIIFRLKFGL